MRAYDFFVHQNTRGVLQKESIFSNFKNAASLLVLANLPCSAIRFERMQAMVMSAITFMGTMLSGTEKENEVNAAVGDCLDQIASYKDYQLGLLPDVRDNFTAEIRRSISRQDMLEIVVWFYLTMTNQF